MRIFILVIGIILTALGVVGIFVPLLPTTPFLLLASLCFSYSSERLSKFLEKSPTLGAYLKNYREGVGVSKKIKAKSLVFLWTGLLTTFLLTQNLKMAVILLVVGGLVTLHIVKL